MRIGLDARLVGPGLGIATFVEELCFALRARDDVDVVWLGRCASAPGDVRVASLAARLPYPALDLSPATVARAGLDVVHFTANTGTPWPTKLATVVTVHDLIFLDRLRGQRSLRQQIGHRYERWVVPRAARGADELVAVSHATAAALERLTGRIAHVVTHGVDVAPGPGPADPPYIVAFGARDPRKATELAVQVFRRARPAVARLELVARAGLPPGFGDLAAAELADGTVRVHRDLSRRALGDLVAGATALLYLSRSEGFGLPVLEAMARGTPVVTGANPATRELGDGAALLVDGSDPVGSAARHVKDLAADRELRGRTREAGLRRAAQTSWADVAARYVGIYSAAIEART